MTKQPTVTDAELAAAARAWGDAWLHCMFDGGRFAQVQAAEAMLYELCVRAAKEREGDE